MKHRISISFELSGDGPERQWEAVDRWLYNHEAVQALPTQWVALTLLTADQVRRELQPLIDPADRLLVSQVTSMSFRNLINDDKFGKGAA